MTSNFQNESSQKRSLVVEKKKKKYILRFWCIFRQGITIFRCHHYHKHNHNRVLYTRRRMKNKRRETKGNGLLSLKTDLRVVFTRRLMVVFPVERTKSPRWLFNVEECHACVASGFVSLICIQRSGYQSRTLSKQERKFIRHRYSSIGELSNESIMRALSLPIALVLFRTAYLRTPGTDIFFFFSIFLLLLRSRIAIASSVKFLSLPPRVNSPLIQHFSPLINVDLKFIIFLFNSSLSWNL